MNLLRLTPVFVSCLCVLGIGLNANAQSITWDGGAGSGNWGDATNWDSDTQPVAGNLLIFSGNVQTATTNNLGAGTSYSGLQFTNDGSSAALSGNFLLSGNSITLGGDIVTTDSSTAITDTISLGLTLDADRAITTGVDHNLSISGLISGAFDLTKNGSGTLILTNDSNSFDVTTINGGTLQIGDGGSTGSLGTGDIFISNGSLLLNRSGGTTLNNGLDTNNASGNMTIRAMQGVNEINLDNVNGNTFLSADSGATLNVVTTTSDNIGFTNVTNSASHIILTGDGDGNMFRTIASGQADGALTKEGTGTWTLHGVNTQGSGWSAATVDPAISDGNININNGTLATGAANVLVWGGSGGGTKGDVVIQAPATLDIAGGVLNINGLAGSGTVDNTGALNNTLTVGHENRTTTFSGVIQNTGSGSLGIIKTGTGNLTLSGTNTYNGNTTVSNGLLIAGSASAFGASATSDLTANGGTLRTNGNSFTFGSIGGTAGTIENGGASDVALTFGGLNTDTTFGGIFQDGAGGGNLSLVKNGTGTLTLTGNSTHTGTTTINAGKLAGEGALVSDLIFASGSTIGVDASTAGNFATTGNLNTSASSINVSIDTPALSPGGIINVIGFGTYTGTAATDFNLVNAGNFRGATFGNTTSVITLDTQAVSNNTWTGTTDGVWEIGGAKSNWTNGSDSLFFNGDAVIFGNSPTTSAVVITGNNVVAANASFTNNSGTNYTISSSASETLQADGGINISGSGNTTINTAIVGAGGIAVSGNGTVALNGDNTFSGDVNVTGNATILVGNGGTTGTLGTGNTALTGSTSSITFNRSDDYTYDGLLSGDGNITKLGAGNLTLTAASTMSDNSVLTINEGTVIQVDSAAASGFTKVVASGATLEFDFDGGAGGSTINLSGNGTFRKTGTGTFTQTSAGSTMALGSGSLFHVEQGLYIFGAGGIGTWANNKSELRVDSGAEFRTSATPAVFDMLTGNGTVRTGGGLTIGIDNGSGTFSGVIRDDTAYNPNSVTKAGTGTQIFTGTNIYTGPTIINGGTLQIGDGGSSGTIGTGDVTNNTNLIFNRSGDYSVAQITGGGNTTVSAGNLTLAGTNYNTNITVGATANLGGEGSNTGNITFQGTTNTITADAGTSAALGTTGSGILDLSSILAGGFTVNVTGTNPGTIVVLTYGTGSLGIDTNKFVLGSNTSSGRGGGSFVDTGSAITLSLGFVNNTWEGGDGSNPTFWDIGTTNNWKNVSDQQFQNGDSVTFDDSAASFTAVLQGNVTADTVTFNNNGNVYTINDNGGGEVLTVTNGIEARGASNSTINADLSTDLITNNGTGTLELGGTVTGNALVIDGPGSLTFSGGINGTGGVTKNGSGTTTVIDVGPDFGGTLNVNAGRLIYRGNGIDSGGTNEANQTTVIAAGATLEFDTDGNNESIDTFDFGGGGTFEKSGNGQFNQVSSGSDITFTAGGLVHVSGGRYQFGGGTPGNWSANLGSMLIDSGATFAGRATSIWIDALDGEGEFQVGGRGTNGAYGLTLGVSNGTGTFLGNIVDSSGASESEFNINKVGTGTQTLSGTNTYTGETDISAGRLNMVGSFTTDITVAANATLGGEGSTTGNLTLGSGSNLVIDPSTMGAFDVGGSLTTSSTITVFLEGGGGLQTGNITVLTYGSGSATPTDFQLDASGVTFRSSTFSDAGGSVVLNLGNVDNTWTGANATNPTFWDINTTNNWNAGGNVYFDGDNVNFTDDVGLSAGNVAIQGNVTAGAVTFTNTAGGNTYNVTSLSGNETLTAIGGISVEGGGNVTIDAQITGTTPVSISNNSTLLIGSNNNDFTGGVSVGNGSTLEYTLNGRMNGITIDTTDGGTVVIDRGLQTGTISGNGGITVDNGGTADLSGTYTYSGNTILNGTTDFRSGLSTSSNSDVFQNNVLVDLENGFDGTVKSWTQTGNNLRFGYNDSGGGSATLTVLENSQFTSIQVLTTGTLNLADGVSANITSSVSQLGDNDSFNANVGAGGFLNIGGAINSGDGNGAFNTGGAGTVRVTANNSAFGGGTRISNGTLEFDSIDNRNVASSLGDADTVDVLQIGSDSNAATLRMIGTDAKNSSNRAVQIGDAGATIEVDDASQVLTLSGIVSGNGSTNLGGLTTGGNGTIALSGQNTYSGGTNVSSGTLLVNNSSGSATGTGAVVVASGATLGGNGSIAGATNIQGGATHTAGATAAAGSVGQQTIGNNLSYGNAATVSWDLISNTTAGAGTNYDQFVVSSGSITFDSVLNLELTFGAGVDFDDAFWNNGAGVNEWQIWDGTVSDVSAITFSLSGDSTAANQQFFKSSAFEIANDNFGMSDTGQGIWLRQVAPVPEPSTYALMGLGLAGFGWFVRRRKKAAQAAE